MVFNMVVILHFLNQAFLQKEILITKSLLYFHYLSITTDIRWDTIEAEMKRDNCSSVRQTANLRMMLHVINSGTETKPVRRSDKARLHSSRLVMDLKYVFFATIIKAKLLMMTINTANAIAGTSTTGWKRPSLMSSNSSSTWIKK